MSEIAMVQIECRVCGCPWTVPKVLEGKWTLLRCPSGHSYNSSTPPDQRIKELVERNMELDEECAKLRRSVRAYRNAAARRKAGVK